MKKVPISGRNLHGQFALVDDSIYPALIGQKLRFKDESARGRSSYVYWRQNSTGKFIRLHRFVMHETDPEVQVDHIDSDPLNNQKDNLRRSTRSQNNKNRNSFKDSSSPYKGVSLDKKTGRWRAQIFSDGRYYSLGSYTDAVEAAAAYDEKARELHGEFAKLNFPDEVINHEGSDLP